MPTEADRLAFRNELAPILARVDDAYRLGRTLTVTTAWSEACDRHEHALAEIAGASRVLYDPRELAEKDAAHRAIMEATTELVQVLDIFTQWDQVAAVFTRGADDVQLELLHRVRRLMSLIPAIMSTGNMQEARTLRDACIDELRRAIPGERGPHARRFSEDFDVDLLATCHRTLIEIIDRARVAGFAVADLAALGDLGRIPARTAIPTAEWASRFIARRLTLYYGEHGCSWQTVSGAIAAALLRGAWPLVATS